MTVIAVLNLHPDELTFYTNAGLPTSSTFIFTLTVEMCEVTSFQADATTSDVSVVFGDLL